MKLLLMTCIQKLTDIRLLVHVVIGDQGSNNRNLFEKQLQASVEKSFFAAFERKIFVLYDPPHLIKNVRNNFKKNGVNVGGYDVKWEYILAIWEVDSKLSIRMAPKLSSRHVDLPLARLRVRLATQVLSHSVAAGICTLCKFGVLPEDAIHTAEFVEKMD